MVTTSRSARVGLAAVLAIAAATGAWQLAEASDHQDTADVELNPTQDMTDFYAFPTTNGRIALVLNSHPFISPSRAASGSFDPNLLYQIKVDNTGDALEDLVFQITFTGSGASQQVQVRGPLMPTVRGAMQNVVSPTAPSVSGAINTVLGSSTGVQVFAGVRDDPFFIDLEQFFRIIPDRKPERGALSMIPETPTASGFRPVGQSVDFLRGLNGMAIVIELPIDMLVADPSNPGRFGVWGTTSRAGR
jgi:hypothetical protein